jgi:hypothetical protein
VLPERFGARVWLTAAGIALINSIGNLGGFVGPTVLGTVRGYQG